MKFFKATDYRPLTAPEFRVIRLQMGMTQKQMAHALGHKHARVVRRWELGEVPVPQTVCRFFAVVHRLPVALRIQVKEWMKAQPPYDGYEK